MRNLFLALAIVFVSLSVFAEEPVVGRPDFVNQLVSNDANKGGAATAWGTTDEGCVWFMYLDESGYIKFFLDSPVPVSTLKSSRKFDVYPRGRQTVIIGDTITSTENKEKVVQNYLKKLEKLGLPALEVKEIIKS